MDGCVLLPMAPSALLAGLQPRLLSDPYTSLAATPTPLQSLRLSRCSGVTQLGLGGAQT